MKRKKIKSLVGWIRKEWDIKMCRFQATMPILFPTDKVWYHAEYVPAVKVKITIEEV